MFVMFEVYYPFPPDEERESKITGMVLENGGRLDYREGPTVAGIGSICLTYQFDERGAADAAASLLRKHGEFVEGPMEYAG
jgi:hypothetical protein